MYLVAIQILTTVPLCCSSSRTEHYYVHCCNTDINYCTVMLQQLKYRALLRTLLQYRYWQLYRCAAAAQGQSTTSYIVAIQILATVPLCCSSSRTEHYFVHCCNTDTDNCTVMLQSSSSIAPCLGIQPSNTLNVPVCKVCLSIKFKELCDIKGSACVYMGLILLKYGALKQANYCQCGGVSYKGSARKGGGGGGGWLKMYGRMDLVKCLLDSRSLPTVLLICIVLFILWHTI